MSEQNGPTKPRQFRLSNDTLATIDALGKRLGLPSRADVLRLAVARLAEAVCDVCGKKFMPWRPRQKGCSSGCMKAGRLARKLARDKKGPCPPRPCVVCGTPFPPDRKNGRTGSWPGRRSAPSVSSEG